MVKCVLVRKGHCDDGGGASLDSVLAFAMRLAPMEVFWLVRLCEVKRLEQCHIFILVFFVPAAMVLATGMDSETIRRSLSKAQEEDMKATGNLLV